MVRARPPGARAAAAGSRRASGDHDAPRRHERARIVQTRASIERHPHARLLARAREEHVGLLGEARPIGWRRRVNASSAFFHLNPRRRRRAIDRVGASSRVVC